MPKYRNKKPLSELRTLQYKKQTYEETICQLERVIEQLQNKKQKWEEEKSQLEEKLKNLIPLSDYSKRLEEEISELKSQLDPFEGLKKQVEEERKRFYSSKLELESIAEKVLQTYQPIRGLRFKQVAFVPHVVHGALIYRDDERRNGCEETDIHRRIFYLSLESWYLHLYRISPDVEDLLIAGLPIENPEILSPLGRRVTILSYDNEKIKAPEGVRILHPNQYFKEKDAVYERLNLSAQIIDGRDVVAPQDVMEESGEIAEKSMNLVKRMDFDYYEPWYLESERLIELKIKLGTHGTMKYDKTGRQSIEV